MSEARVNNLSNESNTGGPTITGITTFSGTNYFVPPVGNTAQRPDNPQKGSIRFNTDSKHLEYFRGDTIGWADVEASNVELGGLQSGDRGTRAIFAGGYTPSAQPNSAFNNSILSGIVNSGLSASGGASSEIVVSITSLTSSYFFLDNFN